MPEAKKGDILNTATGEIVKNPIIVPLHRDVCYIERVPEEDGSDSYSITRHACESDFIREALDGERRDDTGWLLASNGNKVCKTIYLDALLLDSADAESGEPVRIVLRRSKLAPWKGFIDPINRYRNEFPMFAHRRKLTTLNKSFQNGKHTSFIFEFDFVEKDPSGAQRGHVTSSLIKSQKMYDLARDSAEFIVNAIAAGKAKFSDERKSNDEISEVPF